MNRKQWIKEVYRELVKRGAPRGKGTEQDAETLAETYYDDEPNEHTPEEAIIEDYSHA